MPPGCTFAVRASNGSQPCTGPCRWVVTCRPSKTKMLNSLLFEWESGETSPQAPARCEFHQAPEKLIELGQFFSSPPSTTGGLGYMPPTPAAAFNAYFIRCHTDSAACSDRPPSSMANKSHLKINSPSPTE